MYYFLKDLPGLFGGLLRGRFVTKHCKKAGRNLRVLAGARFRSIENLVLGDNVEIGYDNFIQALGGVTIGSNVMTGPGVKIWSVNHNFEDGCKLITDQGQTQEAVNIANDVWLASNVFVMPGVNIPDGVVVSANSVVGKKDYKPYSILAGNPARVIGFRKLSSLTQGDK